MLKRIKQSKHPVDDLVRQLEDRATRENGDSTSLPTKAQISMFMARLGSKGGKIGGKRRLETMTSEERSDAARKAALTRWKNTSQKSGHRKG
jgi:hypothetical protein